LLADTILRKIILGRLKKRPELIESERIITMRITPVFVALAFAVVLPIAAFAQETPRISGFRVNLFNSKTGSFSRDMLSDGAPEMGNVPSGEFASVSVFVAVKIELGKQSSTPKKMQVRLIATESGSMPFAAKRVKAVDRIILDSTSMLGPVDADGNTYVGFWLPKAGCHSISIKASLGVSTKNLSSKTVVLPFACYE
jgi:hypothetical protein